MRPFIFMTTVLGAFVLLTVQYSFWIACAVMYISSMLVVAVIAYLGGSRPSWKSKTKGLKKKPLGIVVERECTPEKRKVA